MKAIFKEQDNRLTLTILKRMPKKVGIFKFEVREWGYKVTSFNIHPALVAKVQQRIEKTLADKDCDRVFGKRLMKVATVARKSDTFSEFAKKKVK